jgi:3-(3-hydroxy-phenyl)propionate hydroxylase
MCQGLRDAGNLAWKLKHVISNQADKSLLQTYTQERRPNVLATTQIAKECGLIISERDPQKAKERDEKILAENNGGTKFILRQNLIPPLDSGLIDLSSPLAGSVFPQPVVSVFNKSNILMDEVTQPCFRLVILEDKISENELLKINQQATSSNIKLIILRSDDSCDAKTESSSIEVIETLGIVRNWLNDAGCIGAIVRPDHYVYSGIVSSSKMADCMSDLTGRLLQ